MKLLDAVQAVLGIVKNVKIPFAAETETDLTKMALSRVHTSAKAAIPQNRYNWSDFWTYYIKQIKTYLITYVDLSTV